MSSNREQEVEQLFLQALEIPPEARVAFLNEACAGDTDLQQDVAALLAADEEAEEFLEEQIVRLSDADFIEADRSDAGSLFGPYRIVETLGEGEISSVYVAERADDEYRKRVAIKLVRRGMASEQILRRFRQERQILASLDHPNIAKLLDGGRTADGRPYFVMEYIDGERIDEYCHRHELGIEARLEIFQTVSAAVHFAHQSLVIHRDLKPGNIMITADGVPKLLDFGIAKLLDPEMMVQGLEPTATVVRLMTPRYASPEQARGEPVTTASDVYSLGVVLYELLTGRRPYPMENLSIAEIERVICDSRPEAPSVVVAQGETGDDRMETLARVSGGVVRQSRRLAGDLDTIVMTALRKEADRRYGSVRELSEDVRCYQDRLPISARPENFGYRAGKFVRRHTVGVAAATVVAASLVGGMALTTWQALVARAERARAEEQQSRAEEQRLRAEQVSDFLIELFKVSDPAEARGETVTAREILDRGSERISNELADQPEVQATMMDTMGVVYQQLGLFERAQELIEAGLEIRRDALGSDHLEVAVSVNNLASVLRKRGEYEVAERLNRDELAMRRGLLGDGHPDVLESLNDLALVLSDQGKYEESEQLFREAVAGRRATATGADEKLATSISNLANVLQKRGRYDEAEQLHRESLEMTLEVFGRDHPNVPVRMNNLSTTLMAAGEYEESERLQREALELRRRLLDDRHPDVATSLNNLASVRLYQGDFEEAEQLQREALAIQQEALGADHPTVANSLSNLASIVVERGDVVESVRLNREALEVARRAFDGPHPLIGRCLVNLGSAVEELGDHREAESLYREAVVVFRETLGEDHINVAAALNNIGALMFRQKQYEEAVRAQRDSLAIIRRAIGDRHPHTALILINLANALEKQGRLADAEQAFRESLSIRREVLPANHHSLANSLVGLGSLLITTGDGAAAEPLLIEALDIRRDALPEDDWRIAAAQSLLGGCLSAQGRYDEAEPLLLDSYSTLEGLLDERPAETRGAIRRLVELYEKWNHRDRAEQYRKLLARLEVQVAAP